MNIKTFAYVIFYFIMTYGLVILIMYLISRIKEESIPFSQISFLLIIGLGLGMLLGIFEQFELGEVQKYYRSACLGVVIAFGLGRLVFHSFAIYAAKGFIRSAIPDIDKDIECELNDILRK